MHRYTMPNGRTDEQPATAVQDETFSGSTARSKQGNNAALVLSVRSPRAPGPTLEDAKRQTDLVAMTDDELQRARRNLNEWAAATGKIRHTHRAACAFVLLKARGAKV